MPLKFRQIDSENVDVNTYRAGVSKPKRREVVLAV